MRDSCYAGAPAGPLAPPGPARVMLALLGILCAALLLPRPVDAGTISPALREQLTRLAPGGEATALLFLQAQADVPALQQALKLEHAGRAERHRRVVEALQQTARTHQPSLLADLEARRARGEISGYTPYWIVNLVVVRGTREALEGVAARADVAMAEADFRGRLIAPVDGIPPVKGDGPRGIGVTPGLRAIHADRVWRELGINGSGVIVATMDTGVDGNHPALRQRWRGACGHPASESWLDVQGSTQFPHDPHGHGTHVTGTVTGLGATTQDTIGVAWGAQWIACNPLGQESGPEFDNDVIHCYQWLADPDGDPYTVDDVPVVVQNSWKIDPSYWGDPPYVRCDVRWWDAIDNCEAAGVVVTFSAGNDGPDPMTLGSPPDRATTPYNVLSVGAVDATHYAWPYPIATWSSRGPTACDVPPELAIKPEVVAPGVDVYSSVPGGGYEQSGWSGTSMAGPHVAGVVALMSAAAPDMDPETIKQILLETARDEGPGGDDNTYGRGFIDAYEAVLRCLSGYGTITGEVTNASHGDSPIAGAQVRLVEIDRTFMTTGSGRYLGMAAPGTYTVEATHPSFLTQAVPGVLIAEGQVTAQNFSLIDIGPPSISGVEYPLSVWDPAAPIPIAAEITDASGLSSAEIVWRVDDGDWSVTAMTSAGEDRYEANLPGQPLGSVIAFYLHAADTVGNSSLDPPNAPDDAYEIRVLFPFYAYDVEVDQGWALSQSGDTQAGRWARMDPWGTRWSGYQVEPADDHTPAPGVNCFVTGAGTEGGPAGQSDVDGGCVTLTSPPIDLSGAGSATVTYWRWFATFGADPNGSFRALASADDGVTWTQLELIETQANSWTRFAASLEGILPLTSHVRFRFIACDTGADNLLEAALDDITVEGVPLSATVDAPPVVAGGLWVRVNPNPFLGHATLRFHIATAGTARLTVFDAAGAAIRMLGGASLSAGEHRLVWDGRDDAGQPVAAGLYFCTLDVEGAQARTRILLLN